MSENDAGNFRGPKPWMLTEEETFSSYSKWQANMVYTLSKDAEFVPFLHQNAKWLPLRPDTPCRGFKDQSDGKKLKKEQLVANLNMMLTRLAQWVPHYLSSEIINESTSLSFVWQTIRAYYGFQQSEVQFMTFSQITWEGPAKERPERLYRRILSHLHDNLLKKDSKLKHNNVTPTIDESISPTVERLAVLRWMELIHPRLPQLVARTFAYDLQRMTLKDIQPQITQSLEGFLDELKREDCQAAYTSVHSEEEVQTSRVFSRFPARGRPARTSTRTPIRTQYRQQPRKQCRLCKAEGRTFWGHDMGSCNYIDPAEKTEIARSCHIDSDVMNQCQEDIIHPTPPEPYENE